MNLSSILLTIIRKLDGERTIYAGFHLLRGKRSGQTLQDVEYYGVKAFFGILPKLSLEQFNEAAKELHDADYISTTDRFACRRDGNWPFKGEWITNLPI